MTRSVRVYFSWLMVHKYIDFIRPLWPWPTLCSAVLVELGPLMHDTTVTFYPAVFLANAIAAFILNLVGLHSIVFLLHWGYLELG